MPTAGNPRCAAERCAHTVHILSCHMHPQGAYDSEGGTRRHNTPVRTLIGPGRRRLAQPATARHRTDEGRSLQAAPFCPFGSAKKRIAAPRRPLPESIDHAGMIDLIIVARG